MTYESCIYTGQVFHKRYLPKQHQFSYDIAMFFLALDELNELAESVERFNVNRKGWIEFRDTDYLDRNKLSAIYEARIPDTANVEERAIGLMRHLSGQVIKGKVFLLSHLRCMGVYFSPVNFYYLQQADGTFSHMLAEVSNTPWNERHCYLVDLTTQTDTDKVFHVSPYNPIDMTYKWHIKQPSELLGLRLDCEKGATHFTAGIQLKRQSLTSDNLRAVLKHIPNMTLKTVFGIYWQALKLFIKRIPIYDHPKRTRV